MNLPLVPSGATALARWALASLLWLLKRPFLMSRRLWNFALVVTLAIDVGAWFALPALYAAALLILPLIVIAVLAQWSWLGKGEKPIVFISLFKGRSEIGRQAAEAHLGALAIYLRESDALAEVGPLEVRVIGLPLSEGQAERLLQVSGALVVIRGTGDAAADASRWEWWAHFRDARPDFMLNKHEFSLVVGESKLSLVERLSSVPPVATSHDVEGDVDVAEFVATSIAINHFNALSKIVGILASELVFERGRQDGGGTLVIPESDDPDLSPNLQGRTAILDAISAVSTGKERLEVLEHLQAICTASVGEEEFAAWVQGQWFTAAVERWRSREQCLDALLEIAERFPDSASVLLNAAGAAVESGRLELASDLVGRAETGDSSDEGIERLRGNIAWAGQDAAAALSHYRAAARKGSPLTRQIGDCYNALGDKRGALRYYRRTLRADSSAGLAIKAARGVRQIPRLLPTIPADWHHGIWLAIHAHPRLVRPALWIWRIRRPEDPWLETFLARHALVVGAVDVARRWTVLAGRIGETNRLISTLDMLIVGCITEEGDLDGGGAFFNEHLDWLAERGIQDPRGQAEAALRGLLDANPKLLDDSARRRLEAVLVKAKVQLPH